MGKSILSVISRLIFPPRCIVCGELLYENETEPLCGGCREKTRFINGTIPRADADITVASAVYYMPPVKAALVNVKSNEDVYKIKGLALLSARAAGRAYRGKRFDIIAVVPSSKKSVRAAGFDRMDTYGRALSRELKIKYEKRALIKTRETKKQHTLSALERLSAQKGAYAASPRVKGRRVLLFDDIVTTGATLSECARALRAAGAAEVCCLTAAATMRSPKKE